MHSASLRRSAAAIGLGALAAGLVALPAPSQANPAGTALVGDFRRAVLFDRESATISVGTVNDDFIRNLIRVLGELRAGHLANADAATSRWDSQPGQN